jgi:hypothetical protein
LPVVIVVEHGGHPQWKQILKDARVPYRKIYALKDVAVQISRREKVTVYDAAERFSITPEVLVKNYGADWDLGNQIDPAAAHGAQVNWRRTHALAKARKAEAEAARAARADALAALPPPRRRRGGATKAGRRPARGRTEARSDPPARRRRGATRAKLAIHEERTLEVEAPPGSRFKGYAGFLVQDLVIRPHVTHFRRECWQAPDGKTVMAALPEGVDGHFGPELRRLVLAQYHQGQVTAPRLVALLRGLGVLISKRQVVRLLIAGKQSFLDEARGVLRAGLHSAAWITVDDTGARYRERLRRPVRDHGFKKPSQLPRAVAGRTWRLRRQ